MAGEVRNDFTKGEVWRVIMRMAIPMMMAQLVNVLYSVVDRMYIGHIPEVGSLALTGIGLTMPIISIISAFANMCGMGGGPLCSIARGEGKLEHAQKIMGNALTMLLILGVVLTVLIQLFMEPVLYLFGASDKTYPYAADYCRIYAWGTIFVMISLGMNSFINAQGFSKMGMLTVLLGAVVNIVLDPVFIFVFDMGIAGAAIATVIAQACSAVWALCFLKSRRAILELSHRYMPLQPKIVGRIMALGTTGFIMSATNGAVQIVCNAQLQRFGGDLYVGVMTVVNSVREVVFMIVHGLTSGAQPVLGYNYGARAYDRVKKGIRFMAAGSVAYSIVVWLLVMLIPKTLAMVFNNEPAMLEACAPAMRMYFCGFIVMSMQMVAQSTFVGLGKARQATFFSLLRKIFIVVPLVYLLPGPLGMGVDGVFWSEPISDLIGGVASFSVMYFTVYRRLGSEPVRDSEK